MNNTIRKQIIPHDGGSLDKYFTEVGKEDLISEEKEIELAQKIREGDKGALDEFVKANLRFVVSIAKKYQHQGLQIQDLINEGNIGLIKAAERFDERKGFKFISFAGPWVRKFILESLANNARLVRIPVNKIDELNKEKKIYEILIRKFEREPVTEEIAEALEMDKKIVGKLLELKQRPLSLDTSISDDNNLSLGNMMKSNLPGTDYDLVQEGLILDVVKRLDKILLPIESQIIKLFFGLDNDREYTLGEIARMLKITEGEVKNYKKKALEKIKSSAFLQNYRD